MCYRPLARRIGWGGELGPRLVCYSERSFILCIKILVNRTRRIRWIDGRHVSLVLRRRVLFVGTRLNRAGFGCHTLAAQKSFLDAMDNGHFEQVPQPLALSETATPFFEKAE